MLTTSRMISELGREASDCIPKPVDLKFGFFDLLDKFVLTVTKLL